jgi:phage repressor protein C with HTH and peptisase S24 domain
MDHADVCANLTAMLARRGESLAALSRLIGRNDAYLQQFVTRGSPRMLGERDRRILAAYIGIDERDLGAPDLAPAAVPVVHVSRIDAVASAGPGGILAEDRASPGEAIDPALLRRLGVTPAALSIIAAQGESMLPTIADGDEMLVDRADNRIGSPGGIYVLRRDGLLVVKRLVRRGTVIWLISDNPDFPTIEVDIGSGDLDVIGRVVRITRLFK